MFCSVERGKILCIHCRQASTAYVKRTGETASSALWHARLGHNIGYHLLHRISAKRLLDGILIFKDIQYDEICSGCFYGKSHRLLFPDSDTRASMHATTPVDSLGHFGANQRP